MFGEDMVYACVKEWNGEELIQQVYSEMHAAHWWWETQVGYDATFRHTSASLPHIRIHN